MARKIFIFSGVILILGGIISVPSPAARENPDQIRYTGEKYPDPTVSPLLVNIQPVLEEASVPLPPLQVQGIIWGPQEPRAIVNDRVVAKGDFLEEAEVLEISRQGIRVFFKGKSHFLKPGGEVQENP